MPRRRTRTVYRSRPVRRRGSSRRGGIGGIFGKLKPVFAGLIAGVGQKFAQPYLGGFTGPAVNGGVGYFMGNETLMTIAGMQAANLVPGIGTSGGTSSGGWY